MNPYAGGPATPAGVAADRSITNRLINSTGSYNGLGGYGGGGGFGGLFPFSGFGSDMGYGIPGGFNPFLFGVLSNPYSGYLSGVASVTTANGQYEVYRQEAIRQRQENIRAVMMNKIEQEKMERQIAEMRRGNAVEAAKLEEAWALEKMRRAPSQTDIRDGRALNSLLRSLIREQRASHRGPKVPLREEDLQSINLAPGGTRANVGLLRNIRNKKRLSWPLSLQNPSFAETREKIDADLTRAVNTLAGNTEVDPGTLKDLNANLQQLRTQVDAANRRGDMSEQEFAGAQRFLRMVDDALRALEEPNVANFFNQKWASDARTVGQLVQFMDRNGLVFAPAVPGDESAYSALYNAMREYDRGMYDELASDR
jgi:hypothetical protein